MTKHIVGATRDGETHVFVFRPNQLNQLYDVMDRTIIQPANNLSCLDRPVLMAMAARLTSGGEGFHFSSSDLKKQEAKE